MTYFAFRAAPLGPVPPAVVVAAFAGFHPDMVAKAIPDAWSRTTPQACLDTRATVSAAALRDAGADPGACERATRLLDPVVAAADRTGRPMFAANAALQPPGDPIGTLWQLATTLREQRGDGHVAALISNGVTGLQAHLLQVANDRFPGVVIRQARGWSEQDWAVAANTLRERRPSYCGARPQADHHRPGAAAPDRIEHGRKCLDWRPVSARGAWCRGDRNHPPVIGARRVHIRDPARDQPNRSVPSGLTTAVRFAHCPRRCVVRRELKAAPPRGGWSCHMAVTHTSSVGAPSWADAHHHHPWLRAAAQALAVSETNVSEIPPGLRGIMPTTSRC